MKMKLAFLCMFLSLGTVAQGNKNVIVKYKQYEKFDLGNMEVKGDIIAPGDLSAGRRERKIFDRDLYKRTHFDDLTKKNLQNLR